MLGAGLADFGRDPDSSDSFEREPKLSLFDMGLTHDFPSDIFYI